MRTLATTPLRTAKPAALIVAVYLSIMPFLAGLPRGSLLPHLRPSEVLQVAATIAALGLLVVALARGASWQLRIRRSEWWLLAMTLAASVLPLLWLVARDQAIGLDEVLAAFPLVKFAALYVLARAAVCSSGDARAIVVASTGAALVVAAVAVAQSLGVGPAVDLVGRFFVGSGEVVADGGRGSATIGSSIAAGTYLAIAATIALSMGFATRRRRWLVAAAALAVGSLASGQFSVAVALVVSLLVVGHLHGRAGGVIRWGLPGLVVGLAALWPIIDARLADIDQGSGVPSSWLVRWVNVTELYWPQLADGGWLLGVSPDATQAPPDIWRDVVYLESGYLWLLWVGGVPLLVAGLLFLATTYRDLDRSRRAATTPTLEALGAAGQASVVVIALATVLDPHLTFRASADLFYVLLAIAAATAPFAERRVAAHDRWRELLGADRALPADQRHGRIQIAEAPAGPGVEATLRVQASSFWGPVAAPIDLTLIRRGAALHAVASRDPGDAGLGTDDGVLVWRGVARCAASLRLSSLTYVHRGVPVVAGRQELERAGSLADELELERAEQCSELLGLFPHRSADPAEDAIANPVRLEVPGKPLRWKRVTDLVLGGLAAIAAAPIVAVCAALVRRSGPGPIIFRQLRIGAGGLPFQMWKFRTMHVGSDDVEQRTQNQRELLGLAEGRKDHDDPRVTPSGRWLRRLSLDELPQLVNVLRGEMSLVGPRPSLLWEVELFASPARRRCTVQPGVTGLWQTSGRGELSMLEMLELDLTYVDSISGAVDARCLSATARSVLSGKGAA